MVGVTLYSASTIERPADLLRGWDAIEWWVGNARAVAQLCVSGLGFRCVAYRGPETGSPYRISYVLQQGSAHFVVTSALEPTDPLWDHVRLHGDGVRALSFAVEDVDRAYAAAVSHGAVPLVDPTVASDRDGHVAVAEVGGYGDTVHRFTSRDHPVWAPGFSGDGLPAVSDEAPVGLTSLDHVVANVAAGDLSAWVAFYRDVFGFTELTHFDRDQISTEFSALRSTVMTDGRSITMPINEPAPGRRPSQIEEYLDAYHGPGVQHIALGTDDIVSAVDRIRRRGVRVLTPPAGYYADARNRMERLGESLPWEQLSRLGILVDREGEGYLLQVFTEPLVDRPTLFLEIIERHGATGFGEGNFKALFEAIEREQDRRGHL
jgi:4-hydroxyphenylpyruvate dioxygenase